jgi:hypothetical protein
MLEELGFVEGFEAKDGATTTTDTHAFATDLDQGDYYVHVHVTMLIYDGTYDGRNAQGYQKLGNDPTKIWSRCKPLSLEFDFWANRIGDYKLTAPALGIQKELGSVEWPSPPPATRPGVRP